ncbi:MAG: radical SAM family heme chaperone HemW [Bacteroidales bacterium]
MSGIYIHIPFCQSKCDYCNFFSLATTRHRDKIAKVISMEARQRKMYLGDSVIKTIYFGGGTPSLLPVGDIELIMNELSLIFPIDSDAEVTLEANPNDLTEDKLTALKKAGINRLSIGVQSFLNDDLVFLNRTHDAAQSERSIELALKAGFGNISIDLIFGLPDQDRKALTTNLETFHRYGIPHLSAYALTVEHGTALAWKIQKNRKKPVSEDIQADHFLLLMDWMEKKGYLQYEISNFCLPGFESKHNSSYWNNEKYLGLGPSAHSYDGISRQWNIASLSRYLEAVNTGQTAFEREILTPEQHREEYLMTKIRTDQGIDLGIYEERFGSEEHKKLLEAAENFIQKGWLISGEGNLYLSRRGKLFTDHITASLF